MIIRAVSASFQEREIVEEATAISNKAGMRGILLGGNYGPLWNVGDIKAIGEGLEFGINCHKRENFRDSTNCGMSLLRFGTVEAEYIRNRMRICVCCTERRVRVHDGFVPEWWAEVC